MRWVKFLYHPEWEPQYIIENGTRKGPFIFSTKWTLVKEQAKILFGDDEGDSWRKELKEAAFNPKFEPPENHIHLARLVISHLSAKNNKLKAELIAARKEVSRLKRNK